MTSGMGSYRVGEARFRDAEAEIARLRLQAELAWPQELAALVRHGLREDATVLEAGCGPGFVTERLLAHVDGSVTALDVDPALLAHAQQLVGPSERVRFVEASVMETGLADDTFDVVVARFLIQHLPEPAAALAELRRVLRPGGRLIVVDSDVTVSLLIDPEPPFQDELMRAVAAVQRHLGGDATIGRRLPRLLADAGLADVAVEAIVVHSALVGRDAIRRTIPVQVLDHMEATGAVSPQLAASARDYIARVDAGDQPFDGMLCYFVASATV